VYFRSFAAAVTFLAITQNLSFAADHDTADEDINGFPASKFCFYGGRAYSLESRLCGGVAQLLTCKQNKENGYAQWEVTPATPEPCPTTPNAIP
jgi:hypothetical protein